MLMMRKRMRLLTQPPRIMLIGKKTLRTIQRRLKKRLKKSRTKIKSKIMPLMPKVQTQDQTQMKKLNKPVINKLQENKLLHNKFNQPLHRDNLQSRKK